MTPKPAVKPEDAQEEPLTAVLLADSFTTKMRPVTSERPKALLPVANSYIIDYTLEWLESQDVKVVYVICCSHADQIKAYLSSSPKWAHSGSDMTLRLVTSYNCASVGEAMRLLDNRGVIEDDFILVHADTVTNMKLKPALDAHRSRRVKDKNAVMTMVMSSGMDEKQRLRFGVNDLVVVMDRASNKLLSFNDCDNGPSSQAMVNVDATFFAERDTLSVRYDLLDSEVYICAPEVLFTFTDNFDYQQMRRDFITGVLSEEELGNKLYVHELDQEYAMRVHNFRTYDAVSRDVLMRWVHPFCPDSNLLVPTLAARFGQPTYFFQKGYRYKESGVNVARSAEIGQCTCIGSGTTIKDYSTVDTSVIGRGCKIGSNVVIEHSYIMSNADIRDGAVIRHAFVCDSATICKNAVLSPGCIIGYNCVVAAGHTVPEYARVTLCSVTDPTEEDSDVETEGPMRRSSGRELPAWDGSASEDDDEDDNLEASDSNTPAPSVLAAAQQLADGDPNPRAAIDFDTEIVGDWGAGFSYHKQMGSVVTLVEQLMSIHLPLSSVAADRVSLLSQQSIGARTESDEEAGAEDINQDDDPEHVFKREVTSTLLRCMHLASTSETPGEMHENAVIELNALKIAEVRSFADCARYVLTTILSLALPPGDHIPPIYHGLFRADAPNVVSPTGQRALLEDLKANLATWASTLRRFLREQEDQIELLLALEEYCGGEGVFAGDQGQMCAPIFSHILMELYEDEIISEVAFLTWESLKNDDEDEDKVFLNMATKFLAWLKEAEEDTSDDSDDSD